MEHPSVLEVSDLTCWSNDTLAATSESSFSDGLQQDVSPHFAVNEDLNKKVYLWSGDVTCLNVDCLILPVNEILFKASNLALSICKAAGPAFERSVDLAMENGDLKTSSVQLSEPHSLSCKRIMQVMEPRISDRFITGVETALHNCYCTSLQQAADNSCRTLAIAPLFQTQDSDVRKRMTHVAIRTMRCCLNKLPRKFDAIVILVEESHLKTYSEMCTWYFPRTQQEAVCALSNLPMHKIGEWGEVIYPDRQIRITDLAANKDSETECSSSGSESTSSEESLVRRINEHSFTKMSGDHDEKRKYQLRMLTQEQEIRAQERIYRRLLRLARTNDLSPIAATNALYLSGKDHEGSPVVVLIAKYMNVPKMDLDGALLYFIHILDTVVREKYSIIYFHTLSQKQNRIPSKFVEKAYNSLDSRYRTNLKYLYIVHPTFWSKVFTWVFATFSTNEIKKKIMFIKNIPQVYQFVSADQIDIPPFVWEHDMQANPSLYPGRKHREAQKKRQASLTSSRLSNSASNP